MGDPRDGSREGIGRRDRYAPGADAAQRLDELLQPCALVEGNALLVSKYKGIDSAAPAAIVLAKNCRLEILV